MQFIEEERSGECLEVHFKTSSRATIAVFCLRFKDANKKDEWKVKTNSFMIALRSSLQGFPCSNQVVHNALQTIDYGPMRDPSKSPHDAVKDDWTSPRGQNTPT